MLLSLLSLRAHVSGAQVESRPALSFRGERYVSLRTPEWKLVTSFEPYGSGFGAPFLSPGALIQLARETLPRHKRNEIGLWHLASDPGEMKRLSLAQHSRAAQLYDRLTELRAQSPLLEVASSAQPNTSAETRAQLEALGYVE